MATNEIIKEFITTKLISDRNGYKLADSDSLIDSGIVDSFGIMALMGFLEEKFSIKMSGDDLLPENFESIISISTMVDSMIERQGDGR